MCGLLCQHAGAFAPKAIPAMEYLKVGAFQVQHDFSFPPRTLSHTHTVHEEERGGFLIQISKA